MIIKHMSAEVKYFPEMCAEIRLAVDGDREVTIVIHESLVDAKTINVEIDGDLEENSPSLRINLNDNLIFDSTRNDPPVRDTRP